MKYKSIMPYKNRQTQLAYLKEYRDLHREDAWWSQKLWKENNLDRKRALDKKSYLKHKKFYSTINKLKRRFINMSDDLLFIEIVDTK